MKNHSRWIASPEMTLFAGSLRGGISTSFSLTNWFFRSVLRKTVRMIELGIRRILSLLTSPRVILAFGGFFFRLLGMRKSRQVFNFSQIKRILILRLDGIGDVVMNIAFLRELRQNLPDAWITLVVKPAVHNLVELCPYVNEVLTYDFNVPGSSWRWMQHIFKPLSRRGCILRPAWKCLWRRQFDLAIVPRWSMDYYRAGFIAYLSGAFWRIGYSENVTDEKRQKNAGFDRWYTHVLTDNNLKNEVEHNLDVIRSLGGRIQDERLELWLGKEDEDFADQIMKSYDINLHKHLVAFCPGAGAPKRMWPLANFIELGDWLIREYYAHILVVGGQGEESLGQEIQQQLGDKVINMVGRATVRQTGALLKHCQLYVGNDTGPMHLAAAAGTPVVEISCHPRTGSLVHDNSPKRFGPWGVLNYVLQPEKAISPCSNECIAVEAAHCILNVSVQQVKKAVEELLHVDIKLAN